MQRDEVTQMVEALKIPKPPVGGAEGLKMAWLQLQLLQEIACQLADLNAKESK